MLLAPGRSPLDGRALADLTWRFRRHLRLAGIAGSDRVAVSLPSGPELAAVFLAIASSAACVPLAPGLSAGEVLRRLQNTHAKALVTVDGFNPAIVALALQHGLQVVQLRFSPTQPAGWFDWDQVNAGSELEPGPETDGSDTALILPTSGTTDHPKLALLSHGTLCELVQRTAASLVLNADDRCLNMLPLFHVHGLVSALLMPLVSGGSVAITENFQPERFGEWMTMFQPTWYSASPAMHQALLEEHRTHPAPLGRLRFIRSGSAPLAPQGIQELERAFKVPLIEAYGMTEVPQITGNPLVRRKVGSVGRSVVPELAVLNEAGQPQPAGTIGEIAVRGVGVHVCDDSASLAPAHPEGSQWFRTGDQGYLDADGYLFVTGRLKEIINRGGEKISPREVDEALLAQPGVAQAVAFALRHATLGEDLAAAVVPKAGATVDEFELREALAARFPRFKVPSRIVVVRELPKGPTGKVQRIGLEDRLAAALVIAYEPPQGEAEAAVAAVFAEVLRLPRVGRHDNFFASGGDSIRAVQVLVRLEAELGFLPPPTTVFRRPTPASLARELARLREGREMEALAFALDELPPEEARKLLAME